MLADKENKKKWLEDFVAQEKKIRKKSGDWSVS